MNMFVSFSKTVIGQLHIQKEIPCEDSSCAFSDSEGRYHIAVVADGHGDPACFRSKIGSQMAVEVSKDALQSFAEMFFPAENNIQSMAATLAFPKARRQAVKQLTDFIISQWTASVLKHLGENPPTEEWENVGKKKEEYLEGKHLEHIYGTTLIAALMVSNWLILIQQGDGRCDVFYEDGAVDQPIPWDDRCFENVTTSLCDADAAQSIRSCVIDTSLQPVIACYLGSDGVEDSYRTMEGTHVFYRELSCELVERPMPEFLGYLEAYLPGFSRNGSGDDVSVAGIVNIERLSVHVNNFRESARVYELNEELEYYESRVISMKRKHGILKRRLEEAQATYEESQSIRDALEEKIAELEKKREILKVQLEEAEALWQQKYEDNSDIQASMDVADEMTETVLSKLKGILGVDMIQEKLSEVLSAERGKLEKIRQELDAVQQQIGQKRTQLEQQLPLYEAVREKYEVAKQEFFQYDDLYRSIQAKCDRIICEMNRSPEESGEDILNES